MPDASGEVEAARWSSQNLTVHNHYHFHEAPGADVVESIDALRIGVNALALAINQLEDHMALNLATLTTEISENTSAVGSAVTLIEAIAAELAQNSGNQAAVDALAAQLSDVTDSLAAAVAANTPAAEEPPAEEPTP